MLSRIPSVGRLACLLCLDYWWSSGQDDFVGWLMTYELRGTRMNMRKERKGMAGGQYMSVYGRWHSFGLAQGMKYQRRSPLEAGCQGVPMLSRRRLEA